jgi:hypothetical protein
MDEEGFSGKDGRTTIFDWWSIGSVGRLWKLIDSGEYKSLDINKITKAGLKAEEAEIFCRFAKATRLAANDAAIGMGKMYDLCWCNHSSEGFDKDRHFAFLRSHEGHTLLIAANFSDKDAEMAVAIPEDAFEWMKIPVTEQLHPGQDMKIDVPARDAVVITLV